MTKTSAQMLTELNAIRVAKGQKPLKKWGESTVKLAETLAKAGGKIEATVVLSHPGSPDLKLGTRELKTSELPKTSATAKKAETPKASKAAPASNNRKGVRTLADGEVHLTAIATSLKMAPKNARAIARANKSAIAKLQVAGKKYVFTKANVAAVKAILEATPEGKK